MRIAVASDHAGFAYKPRIAQLLRELGHEVVDFGTSSEAPVDYPDFVRLAALAFAGGDCEWGVVLCGSGNGEARISLGQRMLGEDEALRWVRTWLAAPFEGGRHVARIRKLDLPG